MPLPHHVERAVKIALAASMSLDLSAGGLRHGSGADQHDRIDVQVVLASHGAANGLQHLGELALLVSLDLENQHELLASVFFKGERRTAIGAQARMALLHGQFNVLWVIVHAAEDYQIFQATGYEQF